MTIDAYHADLTHDSHSSLTLFRESIERYAAVRVFRTMPPKAPTPAMILGTALHTYALEPDEYERRFIRDLVIEPTTELMCLKCGEAAKSRGLCGKHYAELSKCVKDGELSWEDAEEHRLCRKPVSKIKADFDADCEARGLTVLTDRQWSLVPAMFDGLMRNDFGRRWIEADGVVEQPVYGTDIRTGLPVKCRPDKRLRNDLLGDIKSDGIGIDRDTWSATVGNRDYDAQGALYLDITGAGPFVWFVIDTEPPHETAAYPMSETFRAIGTAKNHQTLAELADRRARNDWTGRHSRTLEVIEPQLWYQRKFQGVI